MLVGTPQPAAIDPALGIPQACTDRLILCKHQMQGDWGRAAPPMGSARGKARSQIRQSQASSSKQREGQSPLATTHKVCDAPSGEREGQRPLAIHPTMRQQRGVRGPQPARIHHPIPALKAH